MKEKGWPVPLSWLSPRSLLIIGALFWLLIRLSIYFIDFGVTFTPYAISLMLLFVGMFVLGTYIVPKWSFDRPQPAVAHTSESRLAALRLAADLLFIVTFIFLSLRLYDLLFTRKLLELGGDVQAARYADLAQIEGRTTGGLSFISGIGFPIAIPMMVFAVAFRGYLTKRQNFIAVALFVLYAIYVVLSGNRFIILGPLFLIFVANAMSTDGFRITGKKMAIFAVIIAIAFSFITVGTIARDRLYGTQSSAETFAAAPYRMNFRPTDEFQMWISEQPTLTQDVTWGWVGLAWYINHGMYEYQKLIDYADPSVRQAGVTQFSVAFYFFRVIGLTDIEDNSSDQLPTFGVYNTFFGPVYLDFGPIGGAIFMVILGGVAQFLWLGANKKNLFCILMYPYFSSMIFSFPTNNLITNGLGVPIMAMIVVAYLIVYASGVIKLPKNKSLASAGGQYGSAGEN